MKAAKKTVSYANSEDFKRNRKKAKKGIRLKGSKVRVKRNKK